MLLVGYIWRLFLEDSDYDRKQMVRYKTEKYLIRAEKLYNMYLAPEVKNIQLQVLFCL